MCNKIISDDILYEIHSTSFEKHVFRVPFDWMCDEKNREANAKFFFKLYTMNNDSRDILWHTTHQLN